LGVVRPKSANLLKNQAATHTTRPQPPKSSCSYQNQREDEICRLAY
jgi:hypothetical protein